MKFNLDGHKLHYHPKEVGTFLETGDTYPLYMEVSPVGSCNHRCIFCAYDYIGYPNRKLKKDTLLSILQQMQQNGLKSVLYAGEGEPLLHPDISEIVIQTKKLGIDVGLFTNGELLSKKLNEEIFKSLTFIRFSVNAGTQKVYERIHKRDVFNKIMANIRYSVQLKKDNKLDTTLGVQCVLLPENTHSIENLIQECSKIGLDYISIKPFNLQSNEQFYKMQKPFDLDVLENLFRKFESYTTSTFKVIARVNAFEQHHKKRDYEHCYGCNFITAMNSAGDISTCLPYWDNEKYSYGNINELSFYEIWHGEKRKKIKDFLENRLNVHTCPANCRPNTINRFLYELKHPTVSHLNFI